MLILAAVIVGLPGGSEFAFLSGTIIFAKMLPVPVLDAIFIPAVSFAGVTAVLSMLRFRRALASEYPRTEQGQSLPAAVIGAAVDVFSHRKFMECGTEKARAGAHLFVMYGFIGLFITTTLVGIMYYMNELGMAVQVTPHLLRAPGAGVLPARLCPLHQDGAHLLQDRGHDLRALVRPRHDYAGDPALTGLGGKYASGRRVNLGRKTPPEQHEAVLPRFPTCLSSTLPAACLSF